MSTHQAIHWWNFVYVGDNPRRWAADIGMPEGNTMGYQAGQERQLMDRLTEGINSARSAVSREDSVAQMKAKMNFFKQGQIG